MDKTIITEEIADHIIRTLYNMYAEKLGIKIEIFKKGEKKGEKGNK